MDQVNIIMHDLRKNKLGVVQWSSNGRLTADLTEEGMYFASDLQLFLQDVVSSGELTYKDNQNNGHNLIERKLTVKITDPGFPTALADLINETRFREKSVFAIIAKDRSKGGE